MPVENSVVAPAYLNQAYFEDVLKKLYPGSNIHIKCVSLTAGSSSGDNYCSQIYRVKVCYQKSKASDAEKISLIVKSIALVDELSFLNELQVYHKETLFYTEVLPRLEALVKDTKFAPKCYYSTQHPVYSIVFEDMNQFGYRMADRELGYDEYHTKLVLQKLGKYHAASMVYAKERPEMMKHFQKGFLDPKAITPTTVMYKLFVKYLSYEINMVSQWEGYEDITRKLRRYQKNFNHELFQGHSVVGDTICVLNHGDFWVNNMLIQYDDTKIENIVFVDFQMNVYGSPGIDLNYFLYSSVQLDVLRNTEALLRTYYSALKNTLEQLHYDKIPTYVDIVHEFHRKSAMAIFTLYGPLPIMTMDKSKCDGNTFETLAVGEGSDSKMEATFSSKRLVEHLKYSLKELDKIGAFDSHV